MKEQDSVIQLTQHQLKVTNEIISAKNSAFPKDQYDLAQIKEKDQIIREKDIVIQKKDHDINQIQNVVQTLGLKLRMFITRRIRIRCG